MRNFVAGAFVVLAAVLVACGGSRSGVVPTIGGNAAAPPAQPNTKTARATMRIFIPAPTQQASSRHRLYISSNTQSFGVLAVPATSTATPSAQNLQIFPVATPSPCVAASGGGYSCTLVVTAPVGNDVFFVAAFATASPGPNAVPLSDYVSGSVNVSAGGSPPPLAFSLNAVVNHVQLTVPNPDPVTGNVQIFNASVASSGGDLLGVTAYDSAGNVVLADPKTNFDTPIVITVAPASSGVGLVLGPSTCTSSTSAPTVTNHHRMQFSGGAASVSIACAGDLNNVTFGYDGTIAFDANDHIIDTFAFSAGKLDFASPAPGPATVALASYVNTLQVAAAEGSASLSNASLLSTNGMLLFAAYYSGNSPILGAFDPSTQSVSAPAPIGYLPSYTGMTVAPNGTLWFSDTSGLYCYSSVAGAVSASPVPLVPRIPANDDALSSEGIAADSVGNVWYTGYDPNNTQAYAGYVSSSNGCNISSSPPVQYTLNANNDGYPMFAAPLHGGGVAVQNTGYSGANALYNVTASSSTPVPGVLPALTGTYSSGIATDGAGNIYGAFCNGIACDIETMVQSGSTLASIVSLPPTSGTFTSPQTNGLSAFGPNGGAADRLAYPDTAYDAIGLVENVRSSPIPLHVNLPNAGGVFATAYTNQGSEYALFSDTASNLWLAHILPTTTWSVAEPQVLNFCGGGAALVSIVERGDSGPFTVSLQGGTATPLPGTDHDYWLTGLPSSGTVTLTVSDNHGRTELIKITSTAYSPASCGGARRRPSGKTREQSRTPRIP